MSDQDPARVLLELLLEMESIVQLPAVQSELSRRTVDAPTVQACLDGLAAYLEGDKVAAVENLATAADTIVSQLEAAGATGWKR